MPGLYIHIPFCKRKCNYCDFFSVEQSDFNVRGYLEALFVELNNYKAFAPETMYIGGGTPSLLDNENLTFILENLRSRLDATKVQEFTFEANPESLHDSKLNILKEYGVNRLSLGLQSFSDNHLKNLGRVHTVDDFRSVYGRARLAGYSNINVDIIYGLPNQQMTSFESELEELMYLLPEHISLYPLTIEHGTPFSFYKTEVNEDLQSEMFEKAISMLEKRGYRHYELSNWALRGFESKHNLTYWKNMEYVGIGASAASYMGNKRTKNISDVNRYVEMIQASGSAVCELDDIDQDTRLSEEIILNLRTADGVVLNDDMMEKYSFPVNKLIKENLLTIDNDKIRLTQKGMLFANRVFREFV